MSVLYSITHELHYRYSGAVRGSTTTLYLAPARTLRQLLHSFVLETDPGGPVFEFDGPFGSRGHFCSRPSEHFELRIRADSRVEVIAPDPVPHAIEGDSWESLESSLVEPEQWLMLQPSRYARPHLPALASFMKARGFKKGPTPLKSVHRLWMMLREAFEYAPGSTSVDSPIEAILSSGRGVCQDYAHVMISILRRWGIPSRYVSGYLGGATEGSGSNESHAWVECWLPGLGWVGFDSVNDGACDERHVRVGVGRDYADVPPVRGVFQGVSESRLTTRVEVVPGGGRGAVP